MSQLKHKILSFSRGVEAVKEPDLGFDVFIRRMNGREHSQYQCASFKAHEEEKEAGDAAYLDLPYLLLSLTLCDEKGKLLFDGLDELKDIDHIVIGRLAKKAMDFNGMTDESRAEIEKKLMVQNGSGSTSETVLEKQSTS